ncbi:ABC transporter permease [Achromatium sp. WMS2]|nr:ABC transporter permease [Achromatium sp. WMS2]
MRVIQPKFSYWTALKTLIVKEVTRFLRIWIQTVLPAVTNATLYFLIFGSLIGSNIQAMHGLNYLEYITPGIIMMAVISNSYANSVSSFYQSKFGHYVEELLVAPLPNWVILLGFIAGGISRGLVVGAAVSLVSMLFVGIQVQHYAISILVLILTAALFSLAGFINAVFARNFDDISIVPNFILTPLTYLGGVFYSIHILPAPWNYVSQANPLVYMISAFRYGVLGVTDVSIQLAVGIMLMLIAVLVYFSLWLLKQGWGLKS